MTRLKNDIIRYLSLAGENGPKFSMVIEDHKKTFDAAMGSRHNHQAWPGGYWQHICDAIYIATRICHEFALEPGWGLPFSIKSVITVLFIHDIDKPFMQLSGRPWSKKERQKYRDSLMINYEIRLTDEEQRALKYIRGEGDDYAPDQRKMNELGALCHAADVLSARLWHNRASQLRAGKKSL